MNVSLTPELERLVNEKVKSGLYQTASEVVREALRLLKQRDERMESLRRDVRAGLDDAEGGRYEEHDENSSKLLAADVKARARQRLTTKAKRNRR
jgi:antitoxin ParD1/3/4